MKYIIVEAHTVIHQAETVEAAENKASDLVSRYGKDFLIAEKKEIVKSVPKIERWSGR